MMNSLEFSPYAYFARLLQRWWVVALAILLGGAFGYLFYHLNPPIYEATATIIVTIDLDRFPIQDIREDMIQYNEDMALNTTKVILLSPEVRDSLITELDLVGETLTPSDLLKNYTIERKLDVWELRYRSTDPSLAQKVASFWIKIGYEHMLAWQGAGKVKDYVDFQPPSEASIPGDPILYDRNRVMLAGAVIGLILGILGTNLLNRETKKSS